MSDHNTRIKNQHAAVLENAEMERLEKSIQPIVMMLVIALVAIAADYLLDTYASHKYASEIKTADAFVQCLNKTPVQIGDEWAHCRIEKLSLVAGIK